MPDDITRGTRDIPPVASVYRPGDEITFTYEGNVRATLDGFEVIGGKAWLVARACLVFTIPPSLVVRVEREE